MQDEDEALLQGKLQRVQTEQDLRKHFDEQCTFGPNTFQAEVINHRNTISASFLNYIRDPKKIMSSILNEFVMIELIRNYKYTYFLPDFVAGFCEGCVAVPQGLSYAALAGLPPIWGIYMSMINPAVYFIFGQNRQGSHGTAAIEALIVYEALNAVVGSAPSNPGKKASTAVKAAYTKALAIYNARYARCAVSTTLVAGIIQLLMRVLSLGFVPDLLCQPVLCGFSTGAAVTIASSQLKNFWSINLPNITNDVSLWIMVCQQWHQGNLLNWWTFLFTILGCIFLHLMRFLSNTNKYTKKFPIPGPLLLIIFATIICRQGRLYLKSSKYHVPVVSTIPQGFPVGKVPHLSEFGIKLVGPGMKCGILNYIMSQAFAKTMANIHDYNVTGNNELGSLAIMNIFSSFFSCYPCALSLSRTALVNGVGTKTQAHNIICTFIQIIVLARLTKPLHFLPKCTLTSIIFFALEGMIMLKDGFALLKSRRLEFFFFFLTMVLTIVCGGVVGILTGIGSTFVWLIYLMAQPTCTVMGRMPGTTVYRSTEQFPFARTYPGIQILGFSAPLHFGNTEVLKDKALELGGREGTQWVVFDAYSVWTLDTAGVKVLIQITQDLRKRGVSFLIANWHGPERNLLDVSNLHDTLPQENVFLCLHDAVNFARGNKPSHATIHVAEARGSDEVKSIKVSPSPCES